MDRRSFLSLFGAAAIGATLDPEKLLWIPGHKTIFLPSATSFALDLPLPSIYQLDVLYGFTTLRPELAFRLQSIQQ